MTQQTYEERIVFQITNPGTPREHRAIMPGEYDIALLNFNIAQNEAELRRLEVQDEPREIQDIRDRWKEPDAKPTPDETRKVEMQEQQRLAELNSWAAILHRLREQQQKALDQLLAAENVGDNLEARDFVLREWTYLERLDAEDQYSKLDPLTGVVTPDRPRRNYALLAKCLQGEKLAGRLVPVEIEHLPPKVVQVLIDRQWARTEMSPELAGHFR